MSVDTMRNLINIVSGTKLMESQSTIRRDDAVDGGEGDAEGRKVLEDESECLEEARKSQPALSSLIESAKANLLAL